MLGLKKGIKTRHEKEAIIQEAEAEARNINNRRGKSKITERIVLPPRNNQNRSTRSNTEDNRENMLNRKETFFQKVGKLNKRFETILITTNGNNQNVRIAEQEYNEEHIIPERQLRYVKMYK